MSRTVVLAVRDRLIEQAARQKKGFAIVLHGGEPLLLGFNGLVALLRGLRAQLDPNCYPISIQTNGALLSERLLDLFAETRTSVSVSIDGPAGANDLGRLDHRGGSTFAATANGIERLVTHAECKFLFAGTLSVIQPKIEPSLVYGFLKNLGTPSMDFLLQDGNHDRLPACKNDYESVECGEWLTGLFDVYFADPSPVPIRILDDCIKLCLGGTSQKEGRGKARHGILVIETDGEIRKNDTLRASFEGADKFSDRWNITNTPLAAVLSSREYIKYTEMQLPVSYQCANCDLLDVCGGGMPLYRWSADQGYDNPSVYCRDHALFINHVASRIHELGCVDALLPSVSPNHVS